jgi:hypothetical protein
MVDIIDVACHDALNSLLLIQTSKLTNDSVKAVAFDFNLEVWNSYRLRLKFGYAYAVENVGFHIDVSNEASDFMTLLDYFVKRCSAVFASAPVDDNSHSSAPINGGG